MIRILIFLLGILLFASGVTYFASLDSRFTGEVFGYHFDGPSGLIIGGAFALLLITIYLTHKIKDIMGLPARIKARDAETKRTRGVAALTRGLEAVAVGDGEDAAHHARVARRLLDDVAVTRLLSAQAAQLSGDTKAAQEGFSAMLEAPETEFLGLQGLYAQAMKTDDRDAARGYAERAFRLRPNADWAYHSVFELGLERGAWGDTRIALERAEKNKLVEGAHAQRGKAALLTADAYAVHSIDRQAALSELETALKFAPGFAPAALLAARLYADDSKIGKASKIIETAFSEAPHPALIKQYDRLYKDENNEKRASKLRKLADKAPISDEAILLQARAENLVENWADAVQKLEPLLSNAPTAAAFSLMATAIAGLHGGPSAQVWLEHAANAPRDPRPGADGDFNLTREGWARLVREYMDFGRLAPPPIEALETGLSIDEVRLLAAPPVVEPEILDEQPADETGDTELQVDDANEGGVEAENDVVASGGPEQDDNDEENQEENLASTAEDAERAIKASREVS
ncbi:heme biosynthesis protein HemY [Hyphococcus lacteus]|uniref:Heme biosynthesis HemY N-terminal domain-containing protein n=1 Tax=Hyphococcus lacteus TaxID=3143536 RepID=A0ABV3Z4D7_9PROT